MRGPQGQKVEVANLSASFPMPEFDAARVLLSDGITGRHVTMRIAGKTGSRHVVGQKGWGGPDRSWQFMDDQRNRPRCQKASETCGFNCHVGSLNVGCFC